MQRPNLDRRQDLRHAVHAAGNAASTAAAAAIASACGVSLRLLLAPLGLFGCLLVPRCWRGAAAALVAMLPGIRVRAECGSNSQAGLRLRAGAPERRPVALLQVVTEGLTVIRSQSYNV